MSTDEIMSENNNQTTAKVAIEVLEGTSSKGFLGRLLPFLGPAFIAAVAYVDPGNFATNIQGGAKFGYLLIWVIAVSNIMAMVIQTLSAKLGIATGKNLAEHCRDQFPGWLVWILWVLMELVAIATDLAEFIGAAVGLQLLFGVALFPAAIITAFITFVILYFQKYGFRPLEIIITSFVGVIAISFLLETIIRPPNMGDLTHSLFKPRFEGNESVLLSAGILGATVMPHVIFLHSALTQGRIVTKDPVKLKKLFKLQLVDIIPAMGIAGLVNAAMLVLAASTFHAAGHSDMGDIEQAYKTLEHLLGPASSIIFGISLLASGLSSSAVGTMSGQVIMQGFIRRHIPVWIRRLVTLAPALAVIALGFDATQTLVLSQVILSFGLPFAIIPLVYFTSKREIMGVLTNHKITTIIAWCIAVLIVSLNIYLIFDTLRGWF